MSILISLENRLIEHINANEKRGILELFTELMRFEMLLPMLRATNLSKHVGRLRKHDDSEISSIAKELVDKWKKVVSENVDPFESSNLAAYILIARGGLNAMLEQSGSNAEEFYHEQLALPKDSKALMYGRVVDKHARHNLCFGEENQEPDYAQGKGRVIKFEDVPILNSVRSSINNILGEVGASLSAEGNYYFDPSKCGIGYHGDSERRKVVGVRIGETMPLHMCWFKNSNQYSAVHQFELGHGDVYMFSEKATGWDWKKKVYPTLRHAAGVKLILYYCFK
jgi:hypothetical protein